MESQGLFKESAGRRTPVRVIGSNLKHHIQ